METQKTETYFNHYENGMDYFIYQNNPGEAIKELKKTIELNPQYVQAYYDLGYIYNLLNSPINARKYYKEYLKLNPSAKDSQEIKKIIISLGHRFKYQYAMAS